MQTDTSILSGPAPLPAPPANEGAVTFKSGGFQTFNGLVDKETIYPGTVTGWKRTQSTFGGKTKDQFVFIVVLDQYKDRGELAYYAGTNAVHPKSKLPPFLTAIGARIPTPENPRLPDDIPGRRANFLVKNLPGQDGQVRSKIVEVLAL